eukprot:gb/GECG01013635.1/.p1 GENE.gb/GECG01013635.1/~~gb/GECG01013635.1/.p1  ORF type:complete len:853 (+),score=191.79 gb/GECG01013635.1/:1-2559(+)
MSVNRKQNDKPPKTTGEDENTLMAPKQQRRSPRPRQDNERQDQQQKTALSSSASSLPEIHQAAKGQQKHSTQRSGSAMLPSERRHATQRESTSRVRTQRNSTGRNSEEDVMRKLDELRTGNVGMVPQKSLNPTDMTRTNVRTLMNRNDSKNSADELVKTLQENVYKTLNKKRHEFDEERFQLQRQREKAQQLELKLRDLVCDGAALGLDPDKYIDDLQRQAAEEMKGASSSKDEDPPSGDSSRYNADSEEPGSQQKTAEVSKKGRKEKRVNPERVGMTRKKMRPVKGISAKPVFGNHATLDKKREQYEQLRKKVEKERQKRSTYEHMEARINKEVVNAQKRFQELEEESLRVKTHLSELDNKQVISKEALGKSRARLSELKKRSKEEIKLWEHEVKLKQDWLREKEAFDTFVERQVERAKELEEEEERERQRKEEEKRMRKEIEKIRQAEAMDRKEGERTQQQEEHIRFERCFQRLGLIPPTGEGGDQGTPSRQESVKGSMSPTSTASSASAPTSKENEPMTVQSVLNLCKRQDDARKDLLRKCEDEETNVSELAQELKTVEKYLHQVKVEKEERLTNRYLNILEQELGNEHKAIDHQKAELEYLYDTVQPVRIGLQGVISRLVPDWSGPSYELEERSKSQLYSSVENSSATRTSPAASQQRESGHFTFEDVFEIGEGSEQDNEEESESPPRISVKLLDPREIREVATTLQGKLQVVMDDVRRMQAMHDPEESTKLGLDIGNQKQEGQAGDTSAELMTGVPQTPTGSGSKSQAKGAGAMFAMQTHISQNFQMSPYNPRIPTSKDEESDRKEGEAQEEESEEEDTDNVLDRGSVKKMSVSILRTAPKEENDEN